MTNISPVSPAVNITPPVPVPDRSGREDLKRAESEVLRQERLIRNSEDVTSTVYHYSMSSDGKPYITGATVTVRTSAEKEAGKAEKPRGEIKDKTPQAEKPQKEQDKAASSEQKIDAEASRLKAIEREVIAHEAAHKAVGGQYAGPVSYNYVTGPDGKRYIAGGEVPISAPGGRTPEETIQIMEQVKQAALAPGSPSPQDLRVAASASAAQMRARAEMARQGALKAYSGSGEEQESPEESLSLVA